LPPGDYAWRIRSVDANGYIVDDNVKGVKWESFIPPTSKVKAKMDATFSKNSLLRLLKPSAKAAQKNAAFLLHLDKIDQI